jgi:large subunit ribosomal protein L9
MKAILYKDVPNLGQEGDVVKVSPGYFRNFLVPKQMAVPATESNLKELEFKKKRIEAIRAEKTADAKDLAKKLDGLKLVIRHRCGEKGQLFGSVTTSDIAEALLAENYEIDRRKVVVHEPIKSIGEFEVTLRIYTDVNAAIGITVKPEADQEEEIMAAIKRAEEERIAAEKAAAKAREEAAKRAAEEAEAEGEAGDDAEAAADGEEAKADDAEAK